MDQIQKNARNLERGIEQCLLTQFAAAAPSRILPTHPQLWIRAAQPSGVRWERHSTARPLIRADTRPTRGRISSQPSFTRAFRRWNHKIRHAEEPVSAAGTALRSCRLCYGRRTRARVINYWHQGPNVPPVLSLPTTPSEITRKIRPEQPEDTMWSPLIFAQNLKLAKANVPNGN